MQQEIKNFFKGEVESDDAVLSTYSTDASLFKIRPMLVVFPKDSEDIQNLVKWVNKEKYKHPELSLTVRAAGTCMAGGPLNTSIIVDVTRHMNQIEKIQKTEKKIIRPMFPGSKDVEISGEAIVMPGCFYRNFELEALKMDLLLPCYTASKSINALGGMVGNNSAGELTLRYGKTEDYVRELHMILNDGNEYHFKPLTKSEWLEKLEGDSVESKLYQNLNNILENHQEEISKAKPDVSKNSAGYMIWNIKNNARGEEVIDVPKLIVGSQGTLGIVTKIKFDLIKPAKTSKLLVIFLNKLENLGSIVKEIVELKPESIESYDNKTFNLGIRFFPDFLKTKGIWGSIKFGLSFLPEFWMALTNGAPKLILLVEFAGDSEEEIQKRCREAEEKIKHFNLKTRVTASHGEAEKYWIMRRDSFALLRKHSRGRRTAPFIDDVVVKPEYLPEFLPKLNALLDQYPLIYTIAGHAGNGNFHIIPLMNMDDPATIPTILELSEKVYDLVATYKGSIDGEHNDGIIRTPYLYKMFSKEMISVFEEIKKAFDPQNIFNPGKKVGTTVDDINKYIIKADHPVVHHSS